MSQGAKAAGSDGTGRGRAAAPGTEQAAGKPRCLACLYGLAAVAYASFGVFFQVLPPSSTTSSGSSGSDGRSPACP